MWVLFCLRFVVVAEVQTLKGNVVTEIRANKELEENLNLMDIKIGLLVKNRLTLDVSSWTEMMMQKFSFFF